MNALEPSQGVKDSDNDENSKHEQPGQRQKVSNTHELWEASYSSYTCVTRPLLDFTYTGTRTQTCYETIMNGGKGEPAIF